ncbi:hypothetical protein B0J17DRAFT_664324 [Rhizoctonia solani]|nr:hypothetical protein B0J17DRAFT_664324 [Rhizoctonia solani]
MHHPACILPAQSLCTNGYHGSMCESVIYLRVHNSAIRVCPGLPASFLCAGFSCQRLVENA